MTTSLCPVCGSQEREKTYNSLCAGCGWEFQFYIPPIHPILKKQNSNCLRIKTELIEKNAKIEKLIPKLKRELQTNKSIAEKLQQENKQLEKNCTKWTQKINELKNNAIFQSDTSYIQKTLEELQFEIEDETFSFFDNAIKIHCSLYKDSIEFISDTYIEELPNIVLGFSKNRFLRIEDAEFIVKLNTHNPKTVQSNEVYHVKIPFKIQLKGKHYYKFAKYADSGTNDGNYQIVNIHNQINA